MTEGLQTTSSQRQFLTFRVADEWYALEVTRVRRIEASQELAWVPGAPASLPGLFVSHGQLVPALDPRVVLDLPSSGDGRPAFAVIASEEDFVAGLLVDWVDEVVRVDPGAIQPAGTGRGSDFSSGQVRVQGKLVSLLNLGALFAAIAGE